MPKLLFMDRTERDGIRILHFLQFSHKRENFVVKSFLRRGSDVKEIERSIPEFLDAANDDERKALLEGIDSALAIDSLPASAFSG